MKMKTFYVDGMDLYPYYFTNDAKLPGYPEILLTEEEYEEYTKDMEKFWDWQSKFEKIAKDFFRS